MNTGIQGEQGNYQVHKVNEVSKDWKAIPQGEQGVQG